MAAIRLSHRLTTWQRITGFFSQVRDFYPKLIRFLISALFLLIVFLAAYELIRYDLTIEAFQVPRNLSSDGYTGKVVAYQLGEQIQRTNLKITSPLMLKQNEKSSWLPQELQKPSSLVAASPIVTNEQAMSMQFQGLSKAQNISVPGIGLSLDVIINYLSDLFGIEQNRIYGELIEKDQGYAITVRITGRPSKTLYYDNVNKAIEAAGEYVARTLAPLPIGVNYCFEGSKDSLRKLSNLITELQMQTSSTEEEKSVTFTLLGCWLKTLEEYDNALESLKKADSLTPDNPVNSIIAGDILIAYGDKDGDVEKYKQAIKKYKRAIRLQTQTNNLPVYSRLAQAYIKLGQKHQAFSVYRRALKSGSFIHKSLIYANWGNILLRDEPEAAIEKYQQALAENPAYYLAYAFWGDALYQMKQYEQAADRYAKALRLNDTDPDYAVIYANWGEALLKMKNYGEAIQKYKQALKLNPDILWIYGNWGYALQKQQKYEQAIAVYKQATEKDKLDSWILRDWKVALKEMGDPLLEMLPYYQAYSKAYTDRTPASVYGDWADTLRKLEDYEQAAAKYQMAIETMSGSNTNYKAIVYANWGFTLAKLKQYNAAEGKYKLAKNTKEKMNEVLYEWVYAFWANALSEQKKYNEALAIYEEAAQKYNKLPTWMLKSWGSTLKQVGYPNKEVAIYYETYVKTHPKQASTYHAWGNVLKVTGKFKEALSKYKRAVALSANKPTYCEDWCQTIKKLPNVLEPEQALRQSELTAYQQTSCHRLQPCLELIDAFGEVSTTSK
ncbi:tetratricopeptide repeat protein [Candidatus Albibeggiatoa sp. nov. NOAA]|uniref:tetratricopeptide repeat protein n=1 Tax=Candidatus Albibeggiatoa sp. nov. NOAA TaxID=3162724 RepID=UPI0032F4D6C9|nr:tetratricopeptide repeat protein [Thiotrichaceae bacterium]